MTTWRNRNPDIPVVGGTAVRLLRETASRLLNKPDVQLAGRPSGPAPSARPRRLRTRPPQNWSARALGGVMHDRQTVGEPRCPPTGTGYTDRAIHTVKCCRAVGHELTAWCHVGVRGRATQHRQTPRPMPSVRPRPVCRVGKPRQVEGRRVLVRGSGAAGSDR